MTVLVRVARGMTAFLAYLTVREWVLAQAHPTTLQLLFALALLGWGVGLLADGLFALLEAAERRIAPEAS